VLENICVIRTPVKPHALKPGDTVAVVAPSAAVEREHLERGVRALSAMGFRVKVSERVLARSGILAGDDRDRARELQACFADSEVRAIFSARGGYGFGRLMPLLDFDAIARTPKAFVGFSDATFMLNTLVDLAGMVSFHGPMVAMDFARGLSPRAFQHLQAMLSGELRSFELEARDTVHPGIARGLVIGGCLSVLVASIGTPYAPRFDGRILFLEDTGEKAYRVDRMMVQLRHSGALAKVAGIVFGTIRPVDGNEQESRLIAQFIAEQTADLGVPVLYGIEAGHGTENFTIPFGVEARIEAASRRVIFTEAPVTS
jgi:muramoyltetrapeptide carboxypeptidase